MYMHMNVCVNICVYVYECMCMCMCSCDFVCMCEYMGKYMSKQMLINIGRMGLVHAYWYIFCYLADGGEGLHKNFWRGLM